jgi:hypothetical protein
LQTVILLLLLNDTEKRFSRRRVVVANAKRMGMTIPQREKGGLDPISGGRERVNACFLATDDPATSKKWLSVSMEHYVVVITTVSHICIWFVSVISCVSHEHSVY